MMVYLRDSIDRRACAPIASLRTGVATTKTRVQRKKIREWKEPANASLMNTDDDGDINPAYFHLFDIIMP
jgi:hypothetical protein